MVKRIYIRSLFRYSIADNDIYCIFRATELLVMKGFLKLYRSSAMQSHNSGYAFIYTYTLPVYNFITHLLDAGEEIWTDSTTFEQFMLG